MGISELHATFWITQLGFRYYEISAVNSDDKAVLSLLEPHDHHNSSVSDSVLVK